MSTTLPDNNAVTVHDPIQQQDWEAKQLLTVPTGTDCTHSTDLGSAWVCCSAVHVHLLLRLSTRLTAGGGFLGTNSRRER